MLSSSECGQSEDSRAPAKDVGCPFRAIAKPDPVVALRTEAGECDSNGYTYSFLISLGVFADADAGREATMI